MARPLRVQLEYALYHVTSRGNEKASIFFDERDRHVFIKKISEVADRYSWVIYAYCLMGNHYHLLLRTIHANISQGMRQLNGTYAQYFNERHQRVGHLFQGRFKAILIKDEERLLAVARYVVLNPVRAGLVDRPGEWRWSSYRAMVEMEKPPGFLDPDLILRLFSNQREEAVRLYDSFVYQGVGVTSPLSDARGGIILAGEEPARRVFEELDQEISMEVPHRERHAARPGLEGIFALHGRDEGIYLAVRKHGYRLREVGDFLGMHYSVVSRIAGRVAGRIPFTGSASEN